MLRALDGMQIGCGFAFSLLAGGAAEQCPNNNCDGFRAYSDDWSGYVPAGISYVGDGFIVEGEKLSFDDVEFGPLVTGLASSFENPKQGKKKRRSRPRPEVGAAVGPGAGIFRRLPITIEHFDENKEKQIRDALVKLFSEKCASAFRSAKLRTPIEVAKHEGLIIRPAADLYKYSSTELGFTRPQDHKNLSTNMSPGSSSPQAGTMPAFLNGVQLTNDFKTHIYLGPLAFAGESYFPWSRFSFQDVMSHEFIHGGGKQGEDNLIFHDLKFFGPHNKILKACR